MFLGDLLTTAQWIRRFVEAHPDYKKDSVVSETICYDLLNTFDRIGRGELGAPELFGKPTSKTSENIWRNEEMPPENVMEDEANRGR